MRVKTLKDRILRYFVAVSLIVLVAFVLATSQIMRPEVQAALDAGDTDRAITLLQGDITTDPNYHINYYVLGQIFYDLGRYQDAKEQFLIALDRKSKHYESLYYLGRSHIYLGELDEAKKALERGLKKAKDLKAHFENGMGLLALAREDYQEADRAFRRALAESESCRVGTIKDLEHAPISDEDRSRAIDSVMQQHSRNDAEYHLNLGDANFYQGVPGLAVVEYEKALEVDTASLEVYFHWAEACIDMKDYNCAIDKLHIVLQKDSTHADAWMRAGGIYFKAARSSRSRDERNSRYREAIGSYKKYLELSQAQPDSSTVRVFFELAMSYSGLYGYEDAAPYFEQIVSIPYEPRDIYFYYGKALWGTKDYVKGADVLLRHLEWVSEQDEDFTSGIREVELYQVLGDCYFYRKPKDYGNSIKYYNKSLEANSEQKRLLQNIAVAYHSMKSYGQAIEFYDKRIALGMDSSSASIYRNAGYCASNIANGQGEEDDLEDDEFGDDGGAAGGIDPDVNYYEVAIDYMESYLEYKPNDTNIVLMVASYFFQLSDCANSVTYFERLLTLDPSNCAAKRSLGFAYFGGICTKNYSKALRYLRDAYTCLSAEGGACADKEIVKWIAQAYHLRAVDIKGDASADFKNAFEWYGKCIKCDPGDQECKKGQDDTRFEF